MTPRDLKRDNFNKENSIAPLPSSTTFYLVCIYLSFLICCFNRAPSSSSRSENLALFLCDNSKPHVCSKSSPSLAVFPGDALGLVTAASLLLPRAASQGSAYILCFTERGAKGGECQVFNRFEYQVICLAACLTSSIFHANFWYYRALFHKSTEEIKAKNKRGIKNTVLISKTPHLQYLNCG